jgi:hypothetical protein
LEYTRLIASCSDILTSLSQNGRRAYTTIATRLIQGGSIASTSTSYASEKIDQYQVEARHIYNMDEKGFMLGVVGRSKRIFSKASFEDGKKRSTIRDGSREWITLLACICADGSHLNPALIY